MIFNQILIVDSIPSGERNTALALQHDVEIRAQILQNGPEVLYRRVESAVAFNALLAELSEQAPRRIPILHVECHGDNDRLQFADGSIATWADLKPTLTALNVAAQLNLLVAVAACEGRSIVHTLTLYDRAPFHGLIGATRRIYPDELERGFLAFYETLLATRSANNALAAIRAAVPDAFVYWTAQWLFQHVWDHYQRTHETPEARLERARRNVNNPPPGFEDVQVTVEQFAQLLEKHNRSFFEWCRLNFFLCDLYPQHDEVYPVRYAPSDELIANN